jgi:hypothetical protein
VSQP